MSASPSVRSRSRWLEYATVVEGAAFMVLVGIEGSPWWQCARLALVVGVTAVAVGVSRVTAPRGRAVLALAIGIVGTIAGAAIGIMHLVKDDVSVSMLAGVVCLVAGSALVVGGTVQGLRSAHRVGRLLAIPVAFLLLQFVVLPVTVAVYATNVPRTKLDATTPGDRGLAYVNVTFQTADRVRLSGWYVRSRNGAAVVLMHGSGETRSSVLDHAVVLATHGYGVLLFDARGHGRSGGDANDFGWYGDRDTAAAVTYLEGRPDVDGGRIAAVGESMGGEEALGAAASDHRIAAVVAEGALVRVPADTAPLSKGLEGLIGRADSWIQAEVTAVLSNAPRPIGLRDAVIATAPRRILLIAGKDEIKGDRVLRDASPDNVQLWELPDTPHTRGLATHPAEWRARVLAFLDAALAR